MTPADGPEADVTGGGGTGAAAVYRHGMTAGAYRATRRLGWILAVLFTLLLAAGALILFLLLNRTAASCNFYKDLAGLPVTNAAGTNRPSELGVAIIAHSREAFRGQGCTGTLPPPSPSFRHWAPYYRLSPR